MNSSSENTTSIIAILLALLAIAGMGTGYYFLNKSVKDQNKTITKLQNQFNEAYVTTSPTPTSTTSPTPTQQAEQPIQTSKSYFFENKSTDKSLATIKKDYQLPILYLKGSTLNGDPKISYVDTKGKGDQKDFTFVQLFLPMKTTTAQIGGNEGLLSTGGTCEDSFTIANAAFPLNACKNGTQYEITTTLKTADYNKDLENANSTITYIFVVNGNYTEAQLKTLFSTLTLYK